MASGTKTFKAADYYYIDAVIDLSSLTAATEYTSVIKLFDGAGKRWTKVIFQYVIASIDANAVIRIQGSLDNDSWFNVDVNDEDITITTDGVYAATYEGKGEINYIRFYFVSESAGTDTTIAVKAKVY